MNIFLDNGYIDFNKIINLGCPYMFLISPRGTGKTVGCIKHCIDNNLPFVFMRRTQTQLEMVKRPEYSPFNKLNTEFGYQITTKPNTRYSSNIMQGSKTLGTMLALSTISNLRGFDSDAEVLIVDEFIPEPHEKPIKEEFSAMMNAYETINRNRELVGRKPLYVFFLANSNTLNNPILAGFNLVDIALKKQKEGKNEYINFNRGIALFLVNNSRISEQKMQTALYKATAGTDFYKMAIDNEFAYDYPENIKSMNLIQFLPLLEIKENFCVYKHKYKKIYYVTQHRSGNLDEYEPSQMDIKRVLKKYKRLHKARIQGRVYFESYSLQIKFDNIF